MDIHAMAELLKKEGQITLQHAGYPLTLDMRHRHERLYAMKLLTGAPYPQADIDTQLAHRFIQDGDHVLDAGANIGFTALEFISAGAAHVTALEPISSLHSRLELLRTQQLTPRQEALAATIGRASMYVSEGHNQGSSLSRTITEYFPSIFGSAKEEVNVTTIDEFTKQGIVFDVWKLDIEGAEVDAMVGASETLMSSPPRIIIAEIFDPFLDDFIKILPDIFRVRLRAFIGKSDYSLIVRPYDNFFEESVYHHSPMYIFSRVDV